jgi:glycosyltransferase involved in cell wall biosynthesis
LSRNFGKEAAILAGLDLVDHDAVIIMDGDGEHPSNCLPEMLAAWREGFEVIRMRRIDRSADPWWRRILVRWFYRIIQLSSDVPQIAEVSDFCLLDRVVVDVIRRLPERNRMFKGLISWCGFSSRVLDYTPNRRRDGHSRFGLRGLFRLGILGITSFSTWPLRVWTLVGMGVAFLAALYTLQIVVQVFQYGRDVPGYASLMVSVLFLGGVQLICLGVLGEYIGKIYTEVKQRPQYVIKSDSAESERIDPKA